MAKERMYGWNGEMTAKEPTGQAAIVLRHLKAEPNVLRTGHEWTEIMGSDIKTKQDPYRVVLYYLIVLKGKGVIRTNEYDINAVTKNEEVRHAITVRTQATVEEREKLVNEEPVNEEPVDPFANVEEMVSETV